MTFKVLSAVFKSAVASLSQVIPTKSELPVLSNILLAPSADPGFVQLTASDGDNTISVSMPVDDIEGEVVPFLIPKELVAYVRELSEWPVTIDIKGDELTVSDLFGEFHCVGSHSDADIFPSVTLSEGCFSADIPSDKFIPALQAAVPFTGDDDLRPVMNGVYCRFSESGLSMAASNSKTLFADKASDGSLPDASVILAKKFVSVAHKIFSAKGQPLTFSFDDKRVLLRQGGVSFYGLQIEGKYPRYEAVIPRTYDCLVTVNIEQLRDAISRTAVSASSEGLFRLMFDGEESLVISTNDIDFSRSGKVTVKTESQSGIKGSFEVGVKGSTLTKVLSSAFSDCKTVTFMMSDPSRAIIIKKQPDAVRLALIMPMMLS